MGAAVTREDLEAEVAAARNIAKLFPRSAALNTFTIVQLADERDAAIKRAEEAERQLAEVMEMRERDAPIWDRLGDVAKTLLGTDSAKLADHRDRALALLRLWLAARGGGPMLVSDTRALLAEVDG